MRIWRYLCSTLWWPRVPTAHLGPGGRSTTGPHSAAPDGASGLDPDVDTVLHSCCTSVTFRLHFCCRPGILFLMAAIITGRVPRYAQILHRMRTAARASNCSRLRSVTPSIHPVGRHCGQEARQTWPTVSPFTQSPRQSAPKYPAAHSWHSGPAQCPSSRVQAHRASPMTHVPCPPHARLAFTAGLKPGHSCRQSGPVYPSSHMHAPVPATPSSHAPCPAQMRPEATGQGVEQSGEAYPGLQAQPPAWNAQVPCPEHARPSATGQATWQAAPVYPRTHVQAPLLYTCRKRRAVEAGAGVC